jgi:hypothetical protein
LSALTCGLTRENVQNAPSLNPSPHTHIVLPRSCPSGACLAPGPAARPCRRGRRAHVIATADAVSSLAATAASSSSARSWCPAGGRGAHFVDDCRGLEAPALLAGQHAQPRGWGGATATTPALLASRTDHVHPPHASAASAGGSLARTPPATGPLPRAVSWCSMAQWSWPGWCPWPTRTMLGLVSHR